MGVTIVVITHDGDIVARMDRRIEMVDGRISFDGAQRSSTSPVRSSGGLASKDSPL